jgi:hypothetical protein
MSRLILAVIALLLFALNSCKREEKKEYQGDSFTKPVLIDRYDSCLKIWLDNIRCGNQVDSVLYSVDTMLKIDKVKSLILHKGDSYFDFACFPFRKFKNLEYLCLDGPIEKWPSEVFGLESLKWFNASESKLDSLPDDFLKMSSVKHLSFINNEFRSIPFVLLKMPNLLVVDMDDNKIEKVSKFFTKPKSLRKVYLCGNPLIEAAMYERMKMDSTVKLAWCDPKDNCDDCWKR